MQTPLKVTFPFKWKTAKRSQGNSNCVKVAELPHGARAVMDSKNPLGAVLFFNASEWDAFIDGAKAGEFD